jgi:hypothetical protein
MIASDQNPKLGPLAGPSSPGIQEIENPVIRQWVESAESRQRGLAMRSHRQIASRLKRDCLAVASYLIRVCGSGPK